MKSRFTSFDVACVVAELSETAVGLRVVNVYDINNKTYIIKLGQNEVKKMIMIESGSRIHETKFDWPKQLMPSAFSAKCRKMMKNKRMTKISQLGCDRIVDLQFGGGEVVSHLIIELYDKGNVCLCDKDYVIQGVLRARADDKFDVNYAISHFYPMELTQHLTAPDMEVLKNKCNDIKPNTQLKRWLNSQFVYSIPLIEHALLMAGINPDKKITDNIMDDLDAIYKVLCNAHQMFVELPANNFGGFITLKKLKDSGTEAVFNEFHPIKYSQLENIEVKDYPSYNDCIDAFFFEQETQKIEIKSVQQEKGVLKKLENIKKDHEERINVLRSVQETSKHKAYLIELNLDCVDDAINIVQNAVANRLTWEEIDELVKEGQENNHVVAMAIHKVALEKNEIVMVLKDPYSEEDMFEKVCIDLDLGAYSNAKKYYDEVKQSAQKEYKTAQSSTVALKNAEKKTQATIKDINIVSSIKKARKVFWFEKFLWFFSSEKYIVIGGRDAQQNEILVKKYLKKNDVYVHADIHGATSIIIKNPGPGPVSPKTLMETGCFALCQSSAWAAKIITSAYWVHAEQVSKTAPTGEYLTTGSFMIRGKKNYLPPAQHILGFSVLFRLDDESVERRKNIAKTKPAEEEDEELPQPMNVQEEDEEEVDEEIIQKNNESDEDAESESGSQVSESQSQGGNENEKFDKIFDKYNLHISAVPQPTSSTTEDLTEFIGSTVKPHYKKHQPKQQPHHEKQEQVKKDAQSKRGRMGKNKKKQKYADQSDDEREAKMALLASAGAKNTDKKTKAKNNKLKYKQASTAKNVVAGVGPVSNGAKMTEAERVVSLMERSKISPAPEDVKEPEVNAPGVEAVEAPGVETVEALGEVETSAAAVEMKKIYVKPEEPTAADDDEEEDDATADVLDFLTLQPEAEDTILYGIPFVAPYGSMNSCKFRAKLTPGATKKGKACKSMLDLFTNQKEASLQEKNIFKSLKDTDMTRNIPGKVKISAPKLHRHKK